jgi:hypothetical protein
MSSPQTLNPIDDVISGLKQLIAWTLTQPSRIGYFASLYLRVTDTIRSKIGTGYFDDDARIEQLDATFASRYLAAVQQFRSEDSALPKAWAVALNATNRDDPIIVQHLLLSMNPHIGIDLAIAAARTCPGNSISALQGDFNKINALLASVLPAVISEIDALSPYLHLLADLAQGGETPIIDFSLVASRDASWVMAQKLASLSAAEQERVIVDENVPIASINQAILSPGFIVSELLKTIRSAEVKNTVDIINTLNSGAPIPLQPSTPALSASGLAGPSGRTATTGTSLPQAPATRKFANQVYYFDVAPGSWTGTFNFQVTSWRQLWSSSMSLKNKVLASAMAIFQKIFGDSSISSELTPYPDRGASGLAFNCIRIQKSWLTLWRSDEQYTLHQDGHRVSVDAKVNFGPISFLFREHDVYPATVIDCGMRNLYHIKLLGSRFLGDYRVQPDRRQVLSTLANDWATAHETLNRLPAMNP